MDNGDFIGSYIFFSVRVNYRNKKNICVNLERRGHYEIISGLNPKKMSENMATGKVINKCTENESRSYDKNVEPKMLHYGFKVYSFVIREPNQLTEQFGHSIHSTINNEKSEKNASYLTAERQ